MRIGVFAKTFVRPDWSTALDAAVDAGIPCVQFNMSVAGLPTLPESIPAELTDAIAAGRREKGVEFAALSGTFNMAHPDPRHRKAGLARLETLAAACHAMGAPSITLCSGTRDPKNMWRRHPDNDGADAWNDMCASTRVAAQIGQRHGVTMLVEPEVANVIDSARKARRLLDEIGSPSLRICFDAANIFHAGELPQMRDLLDEAFELLGADVALAHAKDLVHDGAAGDLPAGSGVLDYDLYLSLLRKQGYDGPLVLHGLSETQVPSARDFLRRKIETSGQGTYRSPRA